RARRAGVLEMADVEKLRDDLAGREVALEAGEPAGAEDAAHRAADLRGDADGLARMVEAHALLRHADDDGLDEGVVAEAEEELVGHVGGLLVEDERGGEKVEGV